MIDTTKEQAGREDKLTDFPAAVTIDLVEALSTVPQYWQDKSFSFAHRGTERAIVFWLTSGTREVTLLVDEKGTYAAFKAFISKDLSRDAHATVMTQLATWHPDIDLELEPPADQDTSAGANPGKELFAYTDRDLDAFLASPHACLDTLFGEFDDLERKLAENLNRKSGFGL